MHITSGKVVLIDYTLTNDNKEVIDSSVGREPLAFLYGGGQIIPGLEKALDGRAVGDALRVDVPPEEGYGEHDAEKIITIARSQVQGVTDLKVGIQIQASGGEGPLIFTVTNLSDTEVTLDGNHPLAGTNLHFDVTICEVRDATEEEIAHGHAHGPGGHQH